VEDGEAGGAEEGRKETRKGWGDSVVLHSKKNVSKRISCHLLNLLP